jgi:hypothetical protein
MISNVAVAVAAGVFGAHASTIVLEYREIWWRGRFTITHRSRGHAMARLLDGGSRTCTSPSHRRRPVWGLGPKSHLHEPVSSTPMAWLSCPSAPTPHALLPARRSIQLASAGREHGTTGQRSVQRGHGARGRRSASRRSPCTRAFYILAIITDGKHSKTTLRITPTYLPLLFETTFKYILFANVTRQLMPRTLPHRRHHAKFSSYPPFTLTRTRPPPLTCGTHC